MHGHHGNRRDVARFSDIALPDEIDYVLITHNHQDHVLFETLLRLRHKIKHSIQYTEESNPIMERKSYYTKRKRAGARQWLDETLTYRTSAV